MFPVFLRFLFIYHMQNVSSSMPCSSYFAFVNNFFKSSVVMSPELVGQQIWLLLLRNINAITCSGYSWQISCESCLCRSFRNYIWRIWYWSRPNAQIKVGYCHPIHRRQGRHFKVCSGSVVVTAYDSESGRPGSNPEWGLICYEASIPARTGLTQAFIPPG